MSQDRYAPPSTIVTDVESLPESLARPRSVTLGIRLLWVEIAVGIPSLVNAFYTAAKMVADGTMSRPYGLLVEFVFYATAAFATYSSWKGRNWARLVNLGLLIFSLMMYVVAFATTYALVHKAPEFQPSWGAPVFVLRTLLEIAGVWLLFTASSNVWFRAMSEARISAHER